MTQFLLHGHVLRNVTRFQVRVYGNTCLVKLGEKVQLNPEN
jgi:hypothetical protein